LRTRGFCFMSGVAESAFSCYNDSRN
jgi:hypothetical protein